MIGFSLGRGLGDSLHVLCLGAHSDDIEIGCGGTLRRLLGERSDVSVRWVVFSGNDQRADEARRSASLFLRGARHSEVITHPFRDGFFPYIGGEVKEAFEEIKRGPVPDLIFTHQGKDFHQDHRTISELTWNTFRDHLVLEYEIPKYDGGLSTPNLFVGLDEGQRKEKVSFLMEAFATQRDKRWFSPETFDGLMRLRGVECAAPTGYAEGFHARKLVLAS